MGKEGRQFCDCNRALMLALTPLHPKRYLDLACTEHRASFIADAPIWADYVPDNQLRDGLRNPSSDEVAP